MKRATRYFLTLFWVTGLLGLIVFWFNDLIAGAICALGFVFLLLAYLCEKLSPKPAQYRRNELSTRKNSMGTLETHDTILWASSVTALGGKGHCVELGKVNGIYAIELEEKFTDEFCLVSKIRIRLEGGRKRGLLRSEHSIVVDTGWLCFLTEAGGTAWPDKRLDKRIMDELKKPGGFPLRLKLENEDGKCVGFVTSTGEGDGVYQMKVGAEEGRISSVSIRFM